jgi:hypothetical protein
MTRDSNAVRNRYLVALAVGFMLAVSGSVQAAGPVFWDWPQGRGFEELEMTGTAVDQLGQLVAGLHGRNVGPAGPEVFWTLSADGRGGAYLGTGHGGELHHLDRDGETSLITRLEGTEIFSVLPRDGGGLLVGCGPDGQLFSVDESGMAEQMGQVAGGYVWAMARRPGTQEIWLATGSPAAVYRLTPGGSLEMVQTLPAQNCLTLEFTDDGRLLLGTQGPGLVYRLDPQRARKLEVLFQAPQDEVRQFLRGPEGKLYFLTLNSSEDGQGSASGNGNGKNGGVPASLMSFFETEPEAVVDRSALFSLDEAGGVRKEWAADLDLMIAVYSDSWGWLGGGPLDEETGFSSVYSLQDGAGHHRLARWEGGDILDLLVLPGDDSDRVLVAQAHPGNVRELGRVSGEPALAVSPPLDARHKVTWGRLRWEGRGKLRWSVRVGNSAEPDASWSDWTSTWGDQDRALDVESGRFLQWRVELPGQDRSSDPGPRLEQVSVSAWQDNLPPVVSSLVLEQVSDISLGGMMNGSENVTQTFRSGLKAEYSRSSQQDQRAEGARAAVTRPVRIFTWQGQDANGDRLVYSLEYAMQGQQGWRRIIEETEETIGSWDTSEVPDGRYRVRLTASDARDNPASLALSATSRAVPVVVDNTPPRLNDFRLKAVAGGFLVEFQAADAVSSLAGAVIQLPDGSRQRLDPVDRICDSREERFSARIPWPQAGKPAGPASWPVLVEVRDLAGNLAAAQGEAAGGSR